MRASCSRWSCRARRKEMRRTVVGIGSLCAAAAISLSLAGCPTQPSFTPTITPVYAATNAGLYVYNGTSWTNYTTANGLASNSVSSVVVSGIRLGCDGFRRYRGPASLSPVARHGRRGPLQMVWEATQSTVSSSAQRASTRRQREACHHTITMALPLHGRTAPRSA